MGKSAVRFCNTCHLTSVCSGAYCPRCRGKLFSRKPDSLNRTLALLLSAVILYVPANVLPIMVIYQLGQGEADTIMSGIIELARTGMVPVAIVVFMASIVVPLFKIIGMTLLLMHASGAWLGNSQRLQKLYRFIELIGRWSMLDIFMISVLVSLVQFNVLQIHAGHGATAFAAVVVLTMLASHSFDSRLLWDRQTKYE